MQVIFDKKNKEFGLYFQTILDSDPFYKKIKNLALGLNKNQIELINYNYKKRVTISVDFSKKNYSYMENKDLRKIFRKRGAKILDCTAGFGRDSFMLACSGFDVTMVEKNPIIILLLKNGIRRTIKQAELHDKLSLFYGDSCDYLKLYDELFDYIYIDFMFNKTKDKALSSKVEETLKLITDDRKNRFYLLKLARERCKYKVVVKNLRSSYSIIDVNPDYSIKTKLLRYDVFLGKNESTEEDF